MRARRIGAAIVSSLILIGCSSSSGEESSDTPITSLPPAITEQLEALKAAEDGLSVAEYDQLVAEETASCMRLEGFDFIAVTDSGGSVSVGLAGLSEEEYREQFGFGMLSRIEIEAFQAPPQNPNDEYYDGLAAGEQEAFDEARTGCSLAAAESAGPAPNQVTLSDQALEIIDDITLRAASSDAYVEAEFAWQDCMSSQGYEFESRQDLFAQLGSNAERFAEPFLNSLNALYAAEDLEAASTLTMQDALSRDDYEEYQAAVAFEIEMAQADAVCGADIDTAFNDFYQAEFAALLNE